jgi:hypothetical protein
MGRYWLHRNGQRMTPDLNIMRDLDALLNSLVNIDRDSLVAILSSEAEAAERLANSIRTRTSTQRLIAQATNFRPLTHCVRGFYFLIPDRYKQAINTSGVFAALSTQLLGYRDGANRNFHRPAPRVRSNLAILQLYRWKAIS